MGCCGVSVMRPRSTWAGQDEVELLEIGRGSRKWSISEAQSEGSLHLKDMVATTEAGDPPMLENDERFQARIGDLDRQFQTVVLWGKTREELENLLLTQPITGWKEESIHSLGEIVWSSLVLLHACHTEETSERYLVLFSFQLLILSMDHMKKSFVYQGLLPLTRMNVRDLHRDTSAMFEITGPMIESKVLSCPNPAEFQIWVLGIQHQIKIANAHAPATFSNNISFLVPCDEQWKKRALMKHLFCHLIQQWEGRPIQHLGKIRYLSMVQVACASMGGFEERLLVLFQEDLVLLSIDKERSGIVYEGKLPLSGIQAREKSAMLGRLEFEITGNLVEPMLIVCPTAEDYEKCLFHLQKPEQNLHSVTVQPPPPIVPKKSQRH